MKRCYKIALGMLCALVLMGCGAKEDAEEVVVIEQVEETVESEPVETETIVDENFVEEEPEDILEEEDVAKVEETLPEKKGYLIVIDAGHQQKGNSEKEPIGPGASEMKAKVAGGTTGVSTGIPE